ncbi:MAG: hypothetical protein H6575_00635 [Lewinellaceae bacterium]|nr:hypothetical protein [Saprospiraceae bacterium]MCB9353058.1 hypothetical protein [Lewinellaceae bacterium]
MLKNYLLPGLAWLLATACFAQPVTVTPRSVYIEYAYVDIPEDDMVQKMMFGNTKIKVYADDQYIKLESEVQTPGGMHSMAVRNNKTGETQLYVSIDTLKIRMDDDSQRLTALFGVEDSTLEWKTVEMPGMTIMDVPVQAWSVADPEDSGGTLAFLADHFLPSEGIAQCPVFISRNGKCAGLLLGHDQEYGKFTTHLRATVLEFDQPQEVGALLAEYRPVTKEEGNKLMQKALFGN